MRATSSSTSSSEYQDFRQWQAETKAAWLAEIELCTSPAALEKIANQLGVRIPNPRRPLYLDGDEAFKPPIRQRMRELIWARSGYKRDWEA